MPELLAEWHQAKRCKHQDWAARETRGKTRTDFCKYDSSWRNSLSDAEQIPREFLVAPEEVGTSTGDRERDRCTAAWKGRCRPPTRDCKCNPLSEKKHWFWKEINNFDEIITAKFTAIYDFKRPCRQAHNQPINQANNQSIHQANNPSINQSVDQSNNPSINQSINQSINHSNDRSTNCSSSR